MKQMLVIYLCALLTAGTSLSGASSRAAGATDSQLHPPHTQMVDNKAVAFQYDPISGRFRRLDLPDAQPPFSQQLPAVITQDTKGTTSRSGNSSLGVEDGPPYDSLYRYSNWNGRSTYGDCWGYVDPNTSTEYALICARGEGVSIVDIDQFPPVEVGFMPGPFLDSDSKDVKIKGHFAFVVNEYSNIQIFDISDPYNPVQVNTLFPDGGGAHNCFVEGNYLYVVGNHGVGGLEIWNITNPASTGARIGQFQPYYYHDIDIRNDTLYACAIYGQGIDVLDISDKTNPQFITNFNYPGSGAHNCEISPDGHYLFVGDEIGSSGQWTRVFDISDIFNVQLVAQIIPNPVASAHNCYEKDGYLYIAHYTEGVRIWDVNNPAAPFEVGYYDTYPGASGGYSGAWNVYPYLPSGRIIASDMQTGLYVLQWSDTTVCADPVDDDGDGLGNYCDNCPSVMNIDQYDENYDGIGDACDGQMHIQAYYPPDGYNGEPYFYQLPVIGGTGPYSWSFVGGDLPIGCTFAGDTLGTISGTPAFDAQYFFTVAVMDAASNVDTLSTSITITESPPPPYTCGDVDASGGLSIGDAVFVINYIFGGGPAPNPLAAGDVNCDGSVSIADAVYLIAYIFGGGPVPCASCGP